MLVAILNGLALILLILMPSKKRPSEIISVRVTLSKYYSLVLPQNFFDRFYQRYAKQTFLPIEISKQQLKGGLLMALITLITAWVLMPFSTPIKGGLILSMVFFPVVILELRLEAIDHQIDKSLFSFLSKINARLIQNQDLIQVLQLIETEIDNPYIASGIRSFNRTIRAGLSPEIAFDLLKGSIYHEHLRYIYLNVEQAYLKRGDVGALMRALENEYTAIQVELNKRKIELQTERNFVFLSLFFVGGTAFGIAQTNDFIMQYYAVNPAGQKLMSWLILGVFSGLSLMLYASKVKS